MNDYEITYLSAPELEENARVELDAAIDDQIGQLGGSRSYSSSHAPKRLFFPIQDKSNAGMRTIQIELDPDKVDAVRTFLKKESNILRFSILQTPRREEVQAAVLEQMNQKKAAKPSPKPADKKPVKPVTMEEVEEKIEEALEEEVK